EPSARSRLKHLQVDDATFATIPGLTIHDVMLLPLDRALVFFERLRNSGRCKSGQSPFSPSRSHNVASKRERALTRIFPTPISPLTAAAELVLDEILARLGYLNEVGLGYLTLD